MKQIIVMISMIILGIAIAGYISEFKGSAETISDNANNKIMGIASEGALGL